MKQMVQAACWNLVMKVITWILLLTLCVLQYQIWIHDGGLREQHMQMTQQAERIRQHNDALRRENAFLRAEVNDLEHGFDATSEIARYELGYIEEGEIFYNLKPE